MDALTLITLLILFVSTLIRATFGFGDALIAMPLLGLIMEIQTATPLVAMVNTTIAATICWGSWRTVDFKIGWRLVVSSFVGIPIGLWLLNLASEGLVKGTLGIILILFGWHHLQQPRLIPLLSPYWAYAFGLVAGILGGAYNTNGPPVIIYGILRRWPATLFRATLQGYFLPTGLLILIGHGLGGLWNSQVLRLYSWALPIVLAAIFLGEMIHHRIPLKRFERLLYLVLIILGFLLLFSIRYGH